MSVQPGEQIAFIRVDALPEPRRAAAFSFQAWILPTTPGDGRRQGVITTSSEAEPPTGLFVEPDGRLSIRLRTMEGSWTTVSSSEPLQPRTWYFVAGVTDHTWDGTELDFRCAPEQYAAIHFHEDDLEDAGWDVDFDFEVPEDLPSGVYAARLSADGLEDHIPFAVRPKRGTVTAPMVVLMPTMTYLAYANERLLSGPVAEALAFGDGDDLDMDPADRYLLDHPSSARPATTCIRTEAGCATRRGCVRSRTSGLAIGSGPRARRSGSPPICT